MTLAPLAIANCPALTDYPSTDAPRLENTKMLNGVIAMPEPFRVVEYGSIWISAIANAVNSTPDADGLLYLGNDGCLIYVQREADAPHGSRYVTRIYPGANVLRMAARLAHTATQL